MPIRPENRHYYSTPAWLALRKLILERSGNRCEGSPAYPDCRAHNRQRHPVTASMVVLTIAHVDQDPANNEHSNLRAWCQRCHNKHDAKARAAGIKARKAKATEFPPSQWEDGKAAIARAIAEIRQAEQHFRDGAHLTSLHHCCRFRRVALKIQEAIGNA